MTGTLVLLSDGDTANPNIGCRGTGGTAPNIALNSDDILDFQGETVRTSATMREARDFYTSPGPCGEDVTVSSLTALAACSATLFTVQSLTMVDYIQAGAELATGTSATCPLSVVLNSCNGLSLTTTFTLTIMCPIGA